MSLKKCMGLHNFCLEGGLVSLKRMRNTGCAALWLIFSSNESVCQPANRKTGFYTSRLLNNEEIEGIFVFSGSEL
jgi:hypothetical protein